MPPIYTAYGALALAIVSEVTGSAFLQKSEQFTRPAPTAAMVVAYLLSFFFLSQALKMLPLGIAYAIWGGLGIVLTAVISVVIFKQSLDLWAVMGIVMIVGGVIIMNTLSKTAGH